MGYKDITVKYAESFEREGTVINQSPAYSTAPNLDKTASIVLTVAKNDTTETPSQTVPEESDGDAQVQ